MSLIRQNVAEFNHWWDEKCEELGDLHQK